MSPPRFTPEFKDEAVRKITERGYSVAEEFRQGFAFQHIAFTNGEDYREKQGAKGALICSVADLSQEFCRLGSKIDEKYPRND
jgi:hypothetical protein